MSDIQLIQREMRLAIEQFTVQATVPVLLDLEGPIDQIGTSTLFELENRVFLVTAKHVLDDVDHSSLAIPNPKTRKLRKLGKLNIYHASDELIDVAVLELLDKTAADFAKESWHLLSLANTSEASSTGVFAVSGYPAERLKRAGEGIAASFVTAYSDRVLELPETAEPPAVHGRDLFFGYGPHSTDIDGNQIKAPHLRGVSGASVWEYREPNASEVWTPERCLKVVGVQISSKRDEFFRAQSWSVVLEILRRVDPKLQQSFL